MQNPRFKIRTVLQGDLRKLLVWKNENLDLVFRWDPDTDCWIRERLSTGENLGFFGELEDASPATRKQFMDPGTVAM